MSIKKMESKQSNSCYFNYLVVHKRNKGWNGEYFEHLTLKVEQ
jgi:hypothetical protein